jgi:hypothetical protein
MPLARSGQAAVFHHHRPNIGLLPGLLLYHRGEALPEAAHGKPRQKPF